MPADGRYLLLPRRGSESGPARRSWL